MTDPYAVLGLPRSATEEEVKKKYRALVKQYHPDLHPNDPVAAKKMSEINEAYERIKDGDVYGGSSDFDTESYTSTDSRRRSDGSSYRSQSGGFSGYSQRTQGAYYSGYYSNFGTAASQNMSEDEAYSKIISYILSGELKSASSLLDRMVYRTGMWYYCAAMLKCAEGNYADAVRYADTAVVFDRNDPRFSALASEYHSKFDKIARRSHFLPAVVSAVAMLLVAIYIITFFSDIFGEFFNGIN